MAKTVDKLVLKTDKFQQRHRFFGFPYAVIKKYGEDEAGRQVALMTYYGFLSLFPLLLVVTTITQVLLKNHEELRAKIIDGVTHYFPVIGDQLQNSIHSFHKTGLALVIGILVTIYGARGGASAFQDALNHLWQVPKTDRPGFPKNAGKSIVIMIGGALGIILAAVLSGYATSLDHVFIFRLVPTLVSLALLSILFFYLFRFAVAKGGPNKKQAWVSAASAAVGFQILITVGGYVITHELRNFRSLYGTFALVLGLMFWIYLLAQVVIYAVEIGTVYSLKLWPRSILTNKNMTEADKKAYSLLAKKERYQLSEKIRVHFEKE
jgi:membrane protein